MLLYIGAVLLYSAAGATLEERVIKGIDRVLHRCRMAGMGSEHYGASDLVNQLVQQPVSPSPSVLIPAQRYRVR
jgi:hypothetical protein